MYESEQLRAVLTQLVARQGPGIGDEPGTFVQEGERRCTYCWEECSAAAPFIHAADCPILVGRILLEAIG